MYKVLNVRGWSFLELFSFDNLIKIASITAAIMILPISAVFNGVMPISGVPVRTIPGFKKNETNRMNWKWRSARLIGFVLGWQFNQWDLLDSSRSYAIRHDETPRRGLGLRPVGIGWVCAANQQQLLHVHCCMVTLFFILK